MAREEFDFDFGTDELNDPDYESKVDSEVTPDATTPTPTDGAGEGDTPPAEQTPAQTGDAQQPDPAGSGEPKPQAKTDEQGQQPTGANKVDAKGNIVDDKGNIVATAGAERRHYERAQKQQQYINTLEADVERLRGEAANMQALGEAPQRLGLSAEDVQLGMEAIAGFKKDPVNTAKWMLQETLRLGYNLGDVIGKDAAGQLNGGSLDLQAVKSMISDAIGPMRQDREAQEHQSKIEQDAQREYQQFMAKHENADVHEDVLASMLANDKQLTPEVAYWRLREYATRNGLQFDKPLRAQVEARTSENTSHGNAQPKAQTQQPNVAPMPNGSAPSNDMQTGPTLVNPDTSWDDILRDSLREAGFN